MHQRFTTAIAILLFVSAGLACSFLRPKSPLTWHILLEVDAAIPDREDAVRQTASVIERRLNAFPVYNAKVAPQEGGRILVSLPDVRDRERLTKVLTANGLLELVAVVSVASPAPAQTYATENEAVASLGGAVPANRRVLPYAERAESLTGEQSSGASGQPKRWVIVEVPAIVDGSALRKVGAVQSYGGDEDYQIAFSLGPEGAQKFGAWTEANINNYLGVALNGEVKSIAYIKSRITDQGEISGRFTKQSAEDLALILRSGALPAPVKIIETGDNK